MIWLKRPEPWEAFPDSQSNQPKQKVPPTKMTTQKLVEIAAAIWVLSSPVLLTLIWLELRK
jgi:hypothetical protein